MPKISSRKRDSEGRRKSRREGAAYTIREECERLFCETMKTVFLGERDAVANGSIGVGTNAHSPPDESVDAYYKYSDVFQNSANHISNWLEVWDYRGGSSFRGFVAGEGQDKCLFAFFTAAVVGRDLKQGYV
jgi:hypothetical protein